MNCLVGGWHFWKRPALSSVWWALYVRQNFTSCLLLLFCCTNAQCSITRCLLHSNKHTFWWQRIWIFFKLNIFWILQFQSSFIVFTSQYLEIAINSTWLLVIRTNQNDLIKTSSASCLWAQSAHACVYFTYIGYWCIFT